MVGAPECALRTKPFVFRALQSAVRGRARIHHRTQREDQPTDAGMTIPSGDWTTILWRREYFVTTTPRFVQGWPPARPPHRCRLQNCWFAREWRCDLRRLPHRRCFPLPTIGCDQTRAVNLSRGQPNTSACAATAALEHGCVPICSDLPIDSQRAVTRMRTAPPPWQKTCVRRIQTTSTTTDPLAGKPSRKQFRPRFPKRSHPLPRRSRRRFHHWANITPAPGPPSNPCNLFHQLRVIPFVCTSAFPKTVNSRLDCELK